MGERTGDTRRRLVCSGLGADGIVVTMTVGGDCNGGIPLLSVFTYKLNYQIEMDHYLIRGMYLLLLLLRRPLPDLTICHTVCEGDAGGKRCKVCYSVH